MAKKPTQSSPDRRITPRDAQAGIARLDRLIADLQQFDPAAMTVKYGPQVEALKVRIDDTLSAIFGHGTPRYERYSGASDLDQTRYSVGGDVSLDEYRDGVRGGTAMAIALLTQARDSLREDIGEAGGAADRIYSPTVTVTPPQPPTLAVTIQRGRLELVDPPPTSPLKYNRLPDELPDKLAAVTKALVEVTAAVKGDNGILGDVLKRQLAVLLEVTAAELRAPYADTSRLKAAADTFKNIAVQAAQKGGAEFIKSKLDLAAAALVEAVRGLFQ